jgi:hypothetical protein
MHEILEASGLKAKIGGRNHTKITSNKSHYINRKNIKHPRYIGFYGAGILICGTTKFVERCINNESPL